MLAIIGGTGLATLPDLEGTSTRRVATEYGAADVVEGQLFGQRIVFMPRHGLPPKLPPHRVNYRANVQALKSLDCQDVIAVTAVGGIDPALQLGSIVVPHQIIDYTWGREHTFHSDHIRHIDFTFPYDQSLRDLILATLAAAGVDRADNGVYGCTQGPRLETAAEIERLARDGCSIVGMTGMPEAALAREAGLRYAGVSVVVNKAPGIDGEAIDMASIGTALETGMVDVRRLLRHFVSELGRVPVDLDE